MSFLRHAQRLLRALPFALALLVGQQAYAATYTVTNTNDSGSGSLRQAIIDADANAGTDTINFSIGSGLQTITLGSTLYLNTPIIFNATTQPGFTSAPLIELNGTSAYDVFWVNSGASGSTFRGFIINRLPYAKSCIVTINASNLTIVGNYFGTNAAGTAANNGSAYGIVMDDGTNNIIGGTTAADRNIFAGNGLIGLWLRTGDTGNTVIGNYFGLAPDGTTKIANVGNNIKIDGTSTGNTIGGTNASQRNIISGSNAYGVEITSSGNSVIGNYIGTNAAGTAAIGNSWGVVTFGNNNTIGSSGGRNLISGNNNAGIYLGGTGNGVYGNYIGTNAAGAAAIANSGNGIVVAGNNNVIGAVGVGNVISGNVNMGISLAGVTGNTIISNYLGLSADGLSAIANTSSGIGLEAGANNNVIGGTLASQRNVLSGNTWNGIYLNASTGNSIRGNYIGTNAAGTGAVGNATGFYFLNSANNNTIGGSTAGSGNLISGNTNGIEMVNSTGNTVQANYIGTNPAGTGALANTTYGILLSGTANWNAFVGNVVSGNGSIGVFSNGVSNNSYTGNYVGTNAAGNAAIANGGHGIAFSSGSSNIIGGSTGSERNIISGNTSMGIFVLLASSSNQIKGNFVGTDVTGTVKIANFYGIYVEDSNSTTIGGTAAGEGNLISGNTYDGLNFYNASNGTIQGNYIGTNAAGTAALSNGEQGFELNTSSSGNLIGGSTAAARNIISGNHSYGLLFQISSSNNQIKGNYIGTDVTGTVKIPNGYGIIMRSNSNTIGGTVAGEGNLISGNTLDGVYIDNASNGFVYGNYIGVNASGTAALGNGDTGIQLRNASTGNQIGGTTAAARNVISGNVSAGVYVITASNGNTIQGNYIGTNAAGTAAIANGWRGIALNNASSNTIGGTTSAARNIISGNIDRGLSIESASNNNTISANYFGLGADGTTAIGNSSTNIMLVGSTGNTIGGTTSGQRNVTASSTFDGIELNASSSNTITGNYIGTDSTGTIARGNGRHGIFAWGGSNSNTIGGSAAGAGNVVAASVSDGIKLSNSDSNTIQGNYVGTNSSGAASLGNTRVGIYLEVGSNSNTIGGTTSSARNTISGNGLSGIGLNNSSSNTIQGNYVGVNPAGTAALGNGTYGIQIENNSTSNNIGGSAAGAGNLISGNADMGISIRSNSNIVKGNYIGCNINCTAKISNNGFGIYTYGVSNTLIGGAAAGEGNTVIGSGTTDGIKLHNSSSSIVQGNYIGTNSSGSATLGNSRSGVFLQNSSNNTIGGTNTGEANVIAFNGSIGIRIVNWAGNKILRNSIYANASLGIDLDVNGVTANDTGDADTSSNNYQNYPVLTNASGTTSAITIAGTLNSNASRTYRIEFFASTSQDGTGYGPGQVYLGTTNVTTDGSGNASFTTTLAMAVVNDAYISATATDLTTNDTSEFSANWQAKIVDHYLLSHASTGVTCQAENVTITPHTVAHAPTILYSNVTITLSSTYVSGSNSTGKGNWSIVSGGGTLNNGTADDGVATYTFPATGESAVVLAYANTWAQTVTPRVTDGTKTDITGTAEAHGNIAFTNAAFRLTTTGASNLTLNTQIAGKASNVAPNAQTLYLQAIKTSVDGSGACLPYFPNNTTYSISMASQCINPTTCSSQQVSMTYNSAPAVSATTSIASNAAAPATPLNFTALNVTFSGADSLAPISFSSADVGLMQLWVKYTIPTSGEVMQLVGSNQFTVRPFGFYLDPTGNPAAANAAGAIFKKAGEAFTTSATAKQWSSAADTNNDGIPDTNAAISGNTTTLSFGRETAAESVTLTRTLTQPAGGASGTLGGTPLINSFTNGVGSTSVNFNEVGIITLTGTLTSGSYLSSGATATTTTANVGRFYPDHFTLTSSSVTPWCGSGFTYMGQANLGYAYTVEARNLSDVKTANYNHASFLAPTPTVTLLAENNNSGTNLSSRVNSVAGTWTLGAFTANTSTATFSALGTADGAYDNLRLGVTLTDGDSTVLANRDINPATSASEATPCAACTGIKLGTATTRVRHGRVKMNNVYGSELFPARVPTDIQFFNTGTGWATNTIDTCSTIAPGNIGLAFAAAATRNKLISSASKAFVCTSGSYISGGNRDVNAVRVNGNNTCTGNGIGPGKDFFGYVDVTLTVPSYLQFNWTGSVANPTARATFGTFKSAIVFTREVY